MCVYATTLHYTCTDEEDEKSKGDVKTGMMKNGTGLRHVDKANCAGTCTGDSTDCDAPVKKSCANTDSKNCSPEKHHGREGPDHDEASKEHSGHVD